MIMATVFFLSKLKPGVAAANYETWLREFDYVRAKELSSILSYRTHRIQGHLREEAAIPYDYLEVIEVTDLEQYRKEITEHPAAQAITAEWGNYLELVYSLTGEFVPPGVSRS